MQPSSEWWWALTDSNRRPSACKADAKVRYYFQNAKIILVFFFDVA